MSNIFLLLITITLFAGCKKEPVAEPEPTPIAITDPVKVEYIMKPVSAEGSFKSALTNDIEFTVTDYIGLFNTINRDQERYINPEKVTYKAIALTRQRPAKGTKIVFKGLQNMSGSNLAISIEIDGKTYSYANVEPTADGVAEFNLSYTF